MDDLSRFDLNLLRAFDALLRERSVTRAAERLAVGQPAMSHSLGQLRRALNDKVLVRRGAAMVPTPRALALMEPVAAILAAVRTTVLAPAPFDPATARRTFRIGVSDHLQTHVLPRLLPRLQEKAPGVRLAVSAMDRDGRDAALEIGALDLVIGMPHARRPTIRSCVLGQERLVALFDPEACGCAPPLSLADYLALPHLLMSAHGDVSGAVDDALATLGQRREVILSTPNFLVLPFVLKGLRAVAAVPQSVAEHCGAVARLATCPLPVTVADYDVEMLWHGSNDTEPGHAWLREEILQSR